MHVPCNLCPLIHRSIGILDVCNEYIEALLYIYHEDIKMAVGLDLKCGLTAFQQMYPKCNMSL